MLAQAAEKNKKAVGLVVLTVVHQNGNKMPVPIGTAWAFEKDKFATNAHVAKGLIKTITEIKQFFAKDLLEKYAKENGCKSLDELLKKSARKKRKRLPKNAWKTSKK